MQENSRNIAKINLQLRLTGGYVGELDIRIQSVVDVEVERDIHPVTEHLHPKYPEDLAK